MDVTLGFVAHSEQSFASVRDPDDVRALCARRRRGLFQADVDDSDLDPLAWFAPQAPTALSAALVVFWVGGTGQELAGMGQRASVDDHRLTLVLLLLLGLLGIDPPVAAGPHRARGVYDAMRHAPIKQVHQSRSPSGGRLMVKPEVEMARPPTGDPRTSPVEGLTQVSQ